MMTLGQILGILIVVCFVGLVVVGCIWVLSGDIHRRAARAERRRTALDRRSPDRPRGRHAKRKKSQRV